MGVENINTDSYNVLSTVVITHAVKQAFKCFTTYCVVIILKTSIQIAL